MTTCKGWTKKGSLEEFYNCLGISGCRRLQQECESGEWATWNGSTERGLERKLIYLNYRKNLYINKQLLLFNKNLEPKLMSMEMDSLRRSARSSRLEKKIRNSVIREKMNIKNSVLDSIRYS